MDRDTLTWAVFVAVLAPLLIRETGAPLWQLALHIGMCLALVAIADGIERSH